MSAPNSPADPSIVRSGKISPALGLLIAAAAIGLRLSISRDIGGDQAIFSYPAIVLATLWFGTSAGIIAGIICFFTLWFYVIPVHHSFTVASSMGVITLAVLTVVGAALIWSIGAMRSNLRRFRELNRTLEAQVEERIAERNRVWVCSSELMATVGQDRVLQAVNPAFSRLVDIPSDVLAGCNFADFLEDADQPHFLAAMDRVPLSKDATSFDARIHAPHGAAWISWSMVNDGEFNYLVGRNNGTEPKAEERLRIDRPD